jgi:hypothetical protein
VVRRNVLKLVADCHEQFHDLLGLAGFVALVVGPENVLSRRVHDNRFDSRRANVNANDDAVADETRTRY